jgi:biopolymer transport protein TolR
MSEINVVPYIDVMLVLLVIFMVTAPLMTQGIKVDPPDANSGSLDVGSEEDVLVVTVKADGTYYMNVGEEDEAVAPALVAERTRRVLAANPDIKVLVEGDQALPYGKVVALMDVLQSAGATNLGLITEPPKR